MTKINIDTTHYETSTASLSGDALEIYIDEQIDAVEQLVVTGGTSGTSGVNGTSGSSGVDGTTTIPTLLSITGETILTLENLYVRVSGETYDIFLPASSGSLKTIQIKNLTAGEKSVKVNGNDLIDGLTVKTLALNASIILIDALTGFWDIN